MGQNFSQLVVKEYVDTETGEILSYESQKTFTQKIEKDKFYITYSKNDLWNTDANLNDRKAQSFGKSSAGKFNDGLYGR